MHCVYIAENIEMLSNYLLIEDSFTNMNCWFQAAVSCICFGSQSDLVSLKPHVPLGLNAIGSMRVCRVIFGLGQCGLTPLPFGRICFVVLVMRKGGESS